MFIPDVFSSLWLTFTDSLQVWVQGRNNLTVKVWEKSVLCKLIKTKDLVGIKAFLETTGHIWSRKCARKSVLCVWSVSVWTKHLWGSFVRWNGLWGLIGKGVSWVPENKIYLQAEAGPGLGEPEAYSVWRTLLKKRIFTMTSVQDLGGGPVNERLERHCLFSL